MVGPGYAIFVQGTSLKPVAIRVNNFDDVALVESVVKHVKYLSSVVIDGRVLVISNGEVYGAMPIIASEMETHAHLKAIVTAYPDHRAMDEIFAALPPPHIGDAPPIHVNSADIPAEDETSSLIVSQKRSRAEIIAKRWRRMWKTLEVMFIAAMIAMILGLMIACVVIHLWTGGS